MNRHKIPLGRILGIPIGLDYSWFLIFVLITWTMAVGYYPAQFKNWPMAQYWIVGAVTALGLSRVARRTASARCRSWGGRHHRFELRGLVGDRSLGAEESLPTSDHAQEITTNEEAFLVIQADPGSCPRQAPESEKTFRIPAFAGMRVDFYRNAETAMFNGERS